MSDVKEYFYQQRVVRLRYFAPTRFHDGGWHWECFENGKRLCDSLKQYPFSLEENALENAKEEIDWLLDIDSEEVPVSVGVD